MIDLPAPPQYTARLEELNDVLEKLAFIEPYLSKYGEITFTDNINAADSKGIALLYEICKNGRVTISKPFEFGVSPASDEISGDAAPNIVEHIEWDGRDGLGAHQSVDESARAA